MSQLLGYTRNVLMMQNTVTGYSQKTDWINDPIKAFNAFIVSRDYALTAGRKSSSQFIPLKASSIKVYKAMFSKLHGWMAGKELSLFTIDETHLSLFLDAKDSDGHKQLQSQIKFRYVRMLERIYGHLQIHPNAASTLVLAAVKSRTKLGANEHMVTLNAEEMQRFIEALPPETVTYSGAKPGAGWKHRRDRALQMAILGAGLTVSDAVYLQWSQYTLTDSSERDGLPIQIRRGKFEHIAVLQPFAVPYLRAWDNERREMKIPGPYAFPSHFDSPELFDEKKPLNAASVYRQIANTFRRAGIESFHVGGRNLRNTFAVRLLEQGASEADLKEQLALAQMRSVDRYKNAAKPICKKDTAA